MKRSNFLKLSLGIGTLLAVPFNVVANIRTKFRVGKGFFVAAGKDRFDKSLSLFEGDTFYCKISGKDTENDLYVFESDRLKEGGPLFHFHYDQDEWWYVLEGEFLIKIGEETFHAKKGDSVFGPRMVPHCFAKTGEGLGKLLMIFQPAGKMETYFAKVSEGYTKNKTEEELNQFRKEHGFEVVGPALFHHKN